MNCLKVISQAAIFRKREEINLVDEDIKVETFHPNEIKVENNRVRTKHKI